MTRSAAIGSSESLLATSKGYVQRSTLPLASLLLLLPLMLVYGVGTCFLTTAARNGGEQHIIAFTKMAEFFSLLGATGRHMPALAIVVMLLGWHIARRDPWTVDLRTLAGMAVEGIFLGLPLLLLAFLVDRYFPLVGLKAAGSSAATGAITDRLIMDVGAGVYEEFVFRLVLFTVFSLIFKDLLKFPDTQVYLLMVAGSALLFSVYHYWSPTEHLVFRVFAFRTLAGVYFGAIFMFRGYGITVMSHCAYDVIVTLW